MGVIVVAMVVMGGRGMGIAMTVIAVMLDLVTRGVAGMRAGQGDEPGQNGAQQRQEYDCLNHD
ncbi:hypothetical protein TM233_38910 [Bradyrhizobium sp. TM233]|nr:hypothetical protein TM233_38910 [Bradyrhizobium sp. TM233]